MKIMFTYASSQKIAFVPLVNALKTVTDYLLCSPCTKKITKGAVKQSTNDASNVKSAPKILLVEDTHAIQLVHSHYLKDLGYQVDLAIDGIDALEKFKANYDLILLDISLPKLNGVEVVKAIRALEINKRTPIVALTAEDHYLKDCMQAGCDDFYTKPIASKQLEAVLKRWLSNNK